MYNLEGKLSGSEDQTKGNLFYLDETTKTCLMVKCDDVWLWNKRLFHVNFDNLVSISKMMKLKVLPKLKKPKNTMCKQCHIGKMERSSFKSKNHTSSEILELVHTDLFGPITPKSYCGDIYYILFVDEYYRMMVVMYLKEKFQAFKMFKWYIVRVKKETSKSLKCLRSDRGG